MIIHSPIISGSLEFAEGSTFTLPDGGIYSGSFSGSLQVHQVSSHILPDTNEAYDLGSATNRFRDIYLSNNTIKMPGGSIGINSDGAFTLSDTSGNPVPVVTSEVKVSDAVSGNIIILKVTDGKLQTVATDSSGSSIADPSTSLSGSFTGSFLGNVLSTNGVVSGSSQVTITSTTDFSTFSGSLKTTDDALATVDAAQTVRLDQLATASGSYDSHIASTANPHSVTADQVSLGNVTNESKATMFSSPTFTGTVAGVTATHVGLGNVDNTSDANKPVSTAGQTALDLKANLASPTFTGTPLSTTPSSNDSSTKIATTAYVQGEITDLIGGAGAAFDTLLEISASIANGDSDVVSLTTVVGGKLVKADNLSDLTNTGTARTNLGVAIGTDVQAYNSTLAAVAGGTYSGDDSITTLGTITTGTWQGTAINATYLDGQSGTNTGDETLSSVNALGITSVGTIATGTWQGTAIADTYIASSATWNTASTDRLKWDGGATGLTASTGRTSLGLVIGTDVQAYNSTLAAVAGGTYSGDDSITTVGTIATGTWNGSVIASAYLDADTAHLSGTQTFTGAKTFSASTASTTKTTGAVIVTGGVGIGGALNVGGDVVAYASSDRRLKDNVTNIEFALEKVGKLNGVTWDWNDNADELQKSLPNVGVIAQEVEEVLPQLVITRDTGYKGVDYAKLNGLLIEAIKALHRQVNELENKLNKE